MKKEEIMAEVIRYSTNTRKLTNDEFYAHLSGAPCELRGMIRNYRERGSFENETMQALLAVTEYAGEFP